MAALVVSVLLWLACVSYLVVLYRDGRRREQEELEHRLAVKDRLESLSQTDSARVA